MALVQLSTRVDSRVKKAMEEVCRNLAAEPYPRGARKLQGCEDVFRIRAGTFRIIYSVEEARLLIIDLKIGRRKDVYR